MKRALFILTFSLLTLFVYSQTNKKESPKVDSTQLKATKDSILQAEAIKFVNSIPVVEFRLFLRKRMTAEDYDDKFAGLYNAFIQFKYDEWIKTRKN